jgi:hypothetical protein
VLRFHERRSLIYSASRQDEMKPKLAAFPKCYMDELCVRRTISGSCSLEETPDVVTTGGYCQGFQVADQWA